MCSCHAKLGKIQFQLEPFALNRWSNRLEEISMKIFNPRISYSAVKKDLLHNRFI